MQKGKQPRKAVVLAAGFGSRLSPVTCRCPKPLLPLWGHALIEHHLRMLMRWGVAEVCVNLHHGAEKVKQAIEGMAGIPDIFFSHEPVILGTGGALRPIKDWLGHEPVWVLNADIAADLDLEPFLSAMTNPETIAALWLHSSRGPRTVEVEDGRIGSFRSDRPGTVGTATFCGLQLLRPEIVAYLPDLPFCSIVQAYERAMAEGWSVRGVEPENAFWQDIGTLERVLSVHRETREAARRGMPGGRLYTASADQSDAFDTELVCVGRGVGVPASCKLDHCVLGDGVILAPGAKVRDALVAPGCRVTGDVSGLVACGKDVTAAWMGSVAAWMGCDVSDCVVQGLGTRGSDRSFWRVSSRSTSVVVTRWGEQRRENFRYAQHAGILREAGVRVPAVIAKPDAHTLVLQDLGSVSLEQLVCEDDPRVDGLYHELIQQVVAFHGCGTKKGDVHDIVLEPPFDHDLYRWEHEGFRDHFLMGYLGWSAARSAPSILELSTVAKRLARVPSVLLHRDLQSSNVLIWQDEPWLIDFQGMRMGPAVYDLASLLCDPYVMLPLSRRQALLQEYESLSGTDLSDMFTWAAIQRLCQALGAYGRLSRLPGMTRFEHYIPPALRMLAEVLEGFPGMRALRKGLFSSFARGAD